MSSPKHQKVMDKLAKTKARLVLDQPFFGVLICNLETVITEDLFPPTAATDGKKVYYHPAFVERCTPEELEFLVCHEIMHVALLHMCRLGERHPVKWNFATDYVINDLLVKENIGKMPAGGLYDPQIVAKGEGMAEKVYDLLPDNLQGGGQGGAQEGDGLFDKLMDPGASGASKSEIENDMKVLVAQAAQIAKMRGKLTGNIERFVGELLKSKVNWREVLRRFIAVRAKVEPTFARPKRRFLDSDLYLPSLGGDRMGEIVVCVDCSGSIGGPDLDQFASEIRSIKEDVRPTKVHVIYFDHGVCHYDAFGPDDELVIKPYGGGGTAFEPCFKFVEDHGIEPECMVFLTDGYGSCNCQPPGYATLWVTTGTDQFPFGEVVKMET